MSYWIDINFKAVDKEAARRYKDLFYQHVDWESFDTHGYEKVIDNKLYYICDITIHNSTMFSVYDVLEQIDAVRFMKLDVDEDLHDVYDKIFMGSTVTFSTENKNFTVGDRELVAFMHLQLQDVVDDVKLLNVDLLSIKQQNVDLMNVISQQQEIIQRLSASNEALNVYVKDVVLEKFASLEYIAQRLMEETNNEDIVDEFVTIKIH